jgi:DNA-binding NarL/FixJ family response regulator
MDEAAPLVLVADDHHGVAEAVALVLGVKGLRAAFTSDLRLPALVDTVRELRPSVVLLDLYNGGYGTTIECIPLINRLGTRVVVFTGSRRTTDAEAALAAGATAVLAKRQPLGSVVGAVIAAVGAAAPGAASPDRVRPDRDLAIERLSLLSPRQREVLVSLARGSCAAEIAETEHRSLATIRSHIHSTLTALGVRSQLAAVALAYRAGWLEGELSGARCEHRMDVETVTS